MDKKIKVEFGEMSPEEYADFLNGKDVYNLRMKVVDGKKTTEHWVTLNRITGFKITGDINTGA